MKARPDCIPCLFKQALNTTRAITRDPETQRRVLVETARRLGDVTLNQTPAMLSQLAYSVVSEVCGKSDPYLQTKQRTNAEAQALLPSMQEKIDSSEDPFRTAVRVAAAGNIIDFGIGMEVNMEMDIAGIIARDFAVDVTDMFRADLGPGKKVLYLGDNAGEIVFDKPLLRRIMDTGSKVTFSVKSGPIINDATMEDARAVGLTDMVEVIETGSNDIGIHWERASDEFLRVFADADVILSKGQGNFESCHGHDGNIYYLLKAKCECVAEELGVELWDLVFASSRTQTPES